MTRAGNQCMADFQAHRENAGADGNSHSRVFISLGNGGFSKHGPKAIPSCATVQELDEQMCILIASLKEAHRIARVMLEENAGGFSSDSIPGTTSARRFQD